MINPVAECRLHRRVIHLKRRYLHALLLVDNSFTDIFGKQDGTVRRNVIAVRPNTDVVIVRLLKV